LDEGEKLVATFTPEGATTDARLPIVAMSKFPGATYEVQIDGDTHYGPAAIPPTDVDDTDVTFLPAFQWSESIRGIVRNVSGGDQREATVQVIGWEEVTG
jgi:hypothetical protein